MTIEPKGLSNPVNAIPSRRDPSAVAGGLVFAKIFDLVFAKTCGEKGVQSMAC